MEFRKIYYNFLIASLSRLITGIIGLIIIGFLTRHLGQAGYGSYSTILAYLFIFSVFADFGLHLIHVREISRYPEKENFISSNIFTLRFVLISLAMAVGAVLGFFLPYSKEIKEGILVAILFIYFSSLSQIIGGIFQKYNNFYIVSLSDIFSRLIQLALVVLAVSKNLGLLAFIFILALSSGIHFFIIFYLARSFIKISFKLVLPYAKEILKISFPVAASILFTAIYIRIDTIMLSLMKSQAEVGIYSLSAKVLETMVFFPALFVELAMPTISYAAFKAEDLFREIFKKISKILLISAVLVVVYFFVFAKEVVLILGGEKFLASGLPLKILSLVIGLVFLNNFWGRTLIALDLQKSGMWIYFSGAVFNFFSNLLIIPKYSFIGASFTTLATETIVTFLTIFLIYKKTGNFLSSDIVFKILSVGLITALIIYQFKTNLFLGKNSLNILFSSLIGLITYLILIYFLKVITKEEIKKLLSLIKLKK